jgi:ribokinase
VQDLSRRALEIPMRNRLVVVGSINMDLVAAAVRIPLAGETVSGVSFHAFPGGKGANQAFAAARLGAAVSLIGKVGNDAFGKELRAGLDAAGVDVSAVGIAPTSSGLAQITTASNGENTIVVVGGANAHLSPGDLDDHLVVIRNAGILLTQLEIPLETVEHLALIAQREGIPLILDPAPARPVPRSLLERVDWLTPNETEACSLLEHKAQDLPHEILEEAATRLLACGCRNVIFKLGDRGCYLALSNGRRVLLPSFRVSALDTTGAGDAFNGAFATALLQGKDPVSSALRASAVAAISVTRAGAQPSMPTLPEVDAFLRELTAPEPTV